MIRRASLLSIVCFLAGLICFGQQPRAWWQSVPQVSVGGASTPTIAFVAAADGGVVGAATSLTFSYTVGGGTNRLLVVPVVGDVATDDVSGVTYNSVAMTLAVKLTPTGAVNRWVYLFYLLNPATGANNVVVSAGSSHFIAAGAADYTGVKQSAQPDATTSQAGGAAITTLTTAITTVADNSWAILVENSFEAPATSAGAGAGSTLRTTDAAFGTWTLFDSNGPKSPAGAYNMTTTRGSAVTTIDHIVASFAPL